MNVLHLSPDLHPHAGGVSVLVDALARVQTDAGDSVTVVTTDRFFTGDDDERLFDGGGYAVDVCPAQELGRLRLGPVLMRRLEEAAGSADIVHLHGLWFGWGRWLAGRGRPYVVMPHGMLDPSSLAVRGWRKRTYLKWVEHRTLKQAGRLLFTSVRERELAAQAWPPLLSLDWSPCTPGARPPEGWQPREHPRIRDERPLLLFLGRLHPKKGIELLLDAVAEVPESRLQIAGVGEPDYEQALRHQVDRLDIDDRVEFLGHLDDLRKWNALATADLLVLPSHQENFGLVVAEAMQVGTGVLVSDRVNAAEHVERSGGGRVFAFDGTPGPLTSAIAELLQDPLVLDDLGRRSVAYAREHLTWDRFRTEVTAAYEAVLQ